jgi:hypothetical protein
VTAEEPEHDSYRSKCKDSMRTRRR